MLRLIDNANETGRCCAPCPMSQGSHLSQSRDGPRFHFAFGFRTAQRLARMLDSLVRVSRRVGWNADRHATDPVLAGERGPSQAAVVGHGCPVPNSRTARESHAALHQRRLLGPPADRVSRGYNSQGRSPNLPSSTPSDRPRTGRSALPAGSAHGRQTVSRQTGPRGSLRITSARLPS